MRKKRIISLLCAALLVLGTTGCSTSNQADTDAVNAALDKFCDCSSFSVVQFTKIQETVALDNEKQTYNTDIKMEMDLVTEPVAQMRTSTTAEVSCEGDRMEQFKVSYIVPENGGYAEYFSDGVEWYKVYVERDDALAGVDANSVIGSFLPDNVAFGKVGDDTVDGAKTHHYEGKIGGEQLVSMLEAGGQLSSTAAMSANQQALIKKNLVKDLDEVTVSVWVDEASGYPVRFELDMTEVLKDLEESIAKTLGNKSTDDQWDIAGYDISMTVSNFDAVEALVLPPEAADAQLYETE